MYINYYSNEAANTHEQLNLSVCKRLSNHQYIYCPLIKVIQDLKKCKIRICSETGLISSYQVQ